VTQARSIRAASVSAQNLRRWRSRLRAHVPVSAGGAAWSQREGPSPSTAYPDRNSWTADGAVGAVS